MNTLNTYDYHYRLIFYLDENASEHCIHNWHKLKIKCESGDNKDIVQQIQQYSKLEQNKSLHYLERSEGGLCGDNTGLHKEIRFRHIIMGQQLNGWFIPYKNDNNIVFNEIISTDIETWTYKDIDDLIYAFIKSANHVIGSKFVTGYIEMKNKTMFSEKYLESDSE